MGLLPAPRTESPQTAFPGLFPRSDTKGPGLGGRGPGSPALAGVTSEKPRESNEHGAECLATGESTSNQLACGSLPLPGALPGPFHNGPSAEVPVAGTNSHVQNTIQPKTNMTH